MVNPGFAFGKELLRLENGPNRITCSDDIVLVALFYTTENTNEETNRKENQKLYFELFIWVWTLVNHIIMSPITNCKWIEWPMKRVYTTFLYFK